ncbi:DedA family protein [Candidatus Falkowbacteria bacterium]|nr:DedA family protein [Candidatus Falkowbacteria bacterium]
MIAVIIDWLAQIIIAVISWLGHPGVFVLMALESCGLPIPSEIIMPFAGFLVTTGRLSFWLVVAMGALGNLAGSLLAYWIGWRGGRPLIERYGKYILLSHRDLDLAERWFGRYGDVVVFFGRLLPVVRTYISFPAGLAQMNLKKFAFYTTLGSLPWSLLFAALGVKMGDNWSAVRQWLHDFDLAIVGLLVLLVVLFIFRHRRQRVG